MVAGGEIVTNLHLQAVYRIQTIYVINQKADVYRLAPADTSRFGGISSQENLLVSSVFLNSKFLVYFLIHT
jgi:hypothetical protein